MSEALIKLNLFMLLVLGLTAANAEQSEQNVEPRFKLLDEVAGKMVELVNKTIQDHKIVFEKLLQAAEANENKADDEFKRQIDRFAALVDSINKLKTDDEESLQLTLKLFTIYENISMLTAQYDVTNSRLPLKERLVAELLRDAGLYKAELEFYQEIQRTSQSIKNLVQNFYNNLSDDEKLNEEKMLNWLQNTKSDESFGANLNLLFDFFDIYA